MQGERASLQSLPPIHALLAAPEVVALAAPRDRVRATLRDVLDGLREAIARGEVTGDREALTRLAIERVTARVAAGAAPGMRRVLNATGVVLHTNLGRAPLGDAVLSRMRDAVRGYATLEYDLDAGGRGHRDRCVSPRLAALTGAEDAVVVNNGAAAVLLLATALAAGREVIVSRGELVEIGGGFRIPDVIASCGARLVEVGTTNKTRVDDYARAITPATGMILKVHRSNFAITGFTEEAPLDALVALSRARAIPFVEDLGSGAFVDTRALGLPEEPTARARIAAGVDAVAVSGDKLLGGPQAGVVVGASAVIARLRRHPLMRALRPGRLVLAALDATLQVYAEGTAERDLPALAMLGADPDTVRARAERLCARMAERCPAVSWSVVPTEGRVGGGTLPTAVVRSWAVRVGGVSATALERALRRSETPVVARVADDAVMLDLRAVDPADDDDLARSVTESVARAVDPTQNRAAFEDAVGFTVASAVKEPFDE